MKLKVLAFDSEMLPQNSQMPNPEKCPIMLISFSTNYDIMNGKRKVIFVLNRSKNNTNLSEGIQVREEFNDVIVRFNDEGKMIREWETLVKKCDVITGYNIAGFDIPYIYDRSKALHVGQLKIGQSNENLWTKKHLSKGRSVVKIGGIKGKILEDVLYILRRDDASNTIKADYNLKNLKLEVTAKEVLGKEKKDFSMEEMIDYWENGTNEEEFINYCSVDSELALEFMTKFRLLDKFIGLSRRSGKLIQDIIDSQGFGGLVENLLQREFVKLDRVIPCRGKTYSSLRRDEEDDLKGAFVLNPKLGISDNVVIADYTSLYPTLMIKHNLCYTTIITDNKIVNDETIMNIIRDEQGIIIGRFVKSHILKGIIPTILESLTLERKTAKFEMVKHEKGTPTYLTLDSEQNATKILMNTFYGYTGEQDAKLYYYAIAASVTGTGQKQIKYTIKMIDDTIVTDIDGKQYKMKIIQGDTDSIYVQLIPLIADSVLNREICVRVVSKELEKINITLEKPMKITFEDYVKRILITAKKRYTKIIVDEKGKETVLSKGIETIRREWCDFASDSLEKAINIILFEEKVDVGIKKMIDLIQNEAEKLKKGQIDIRKLTLSKQLTKATTYYSNDAVHVKVAILMKQRGRPSEIGDRIQYIVVDNGKKLIGDRAEEADHVISGKCPYKIDTNYYINNQLYPPVLRMLKVLGVDKNQLTRDERQHLLSDYK
jgi:DNA polymerase I